MMIFRRKKPKTKAIADTLTLGYDLYHWHDYGLKLPINADLSSSNNSHILICGMSGSGKSYAQLGYIAKMFLTQPDSEFWFADYKGDDNFGFLRSCPRYRSYHSTLEALDAVYDRLNARLSGEEENRQPVTLIWDEYMANMLALVAEDKDKKPADRIAPSAMSKVSEILLMGRSKGVRLVCSLQRPDAIAFPVGSRLNYGIVIVLGAAVRSIYEMLMPDHIEQVKGREFGRGEGVALLQGSELHYLKIPQYKDFERVKELCVQALS
jgi:hypothetical protein